jgi:hypothetical protein
VTFSAGVTPPATPPAPPVPTQATAGADAVANTSGSNGTTTVGSGGTWSFTPTTPLLAGTSYNVQAFQILANYVSIPGSNIPTFTTAAAPATAVTISGTSSAGNNTASIVFSDANEAADSVATYNVYRANGGGTAFTDASTAKIGSVAASAAASYTFVDSSAVNGNTYTWFVTPVNGFGAEKTLPAPTGVTPNTSIGPVVSGVTISPNPVAQGSNVTYSATVSQGATVDPAAIAKTLTVFTGVKLHILNNVGIEQSSTTMTAGSGVSSSGYGSYSLTQASPAQGSYTDNTVATDANGTAGNSTAAFTVGAAPAVTTITVSANPSSINNGQFSNIIATVKDQYGNPMGGQAVTFSVSPASSNGAGGKVPAGTVTTLSNGQAQTTYTAGSPAQTNSDTVKAAIGSVSGTATVTVTPLNPPGTGVPYMTGASTSSATTVTVTYNMLVALSNAAAAADFTLGVCHPATAAVSGTSGNTVILTFTVAACATFTNLVTGTAAGNLNYTGGAAVVQSTATTPVAAFSPQDVWVSSGF